MSRRRKMCGKLTAAGNPCKNGSGCTVNHRIAPGGPVTARTPADIARRLAATPERTAAAVADRGAALELAARQTLLFEYLEAEAEAVNRRRKITMSVLRDDQGFLSSTLARLITYFTSPAEMAKVRAKAAAKAAAKGKDFDADSVDAVTPTRVRQMAIEGAKMRGIKKDPASSSRGRPPEPAESRLANAYQHLVALKATDPDRYDQIIADLAAATGPEGEAGP